jgi:hypothetical protein
MPLSLQAMFGNRKLFVRLHMNASRTVVSKALPVLHLLLPALGLVAIPLPEAAADVFFRRGDANGSGTADLSDGVHTLNNLFLGGPRAECEDAADADDMGTISLTTAIYYFNALFLGGPAVPAPGIRECGHDPTLDALDCKRYDACPQEGACLSSADCEAGSYCAKLDGDCDGEGQCLPRPAACPPLFDPVCGCDGRTYGNGCEAAAAGVSVAHRGPCFSLGNCDSNDDCAEGFYCAKEEGDCAGPGSCTERPLICPENYDPVCGCDGVTYGNACEAAAAGVSVAHRGECAPQADCATNAECPAGSYCQKAEGDCEGRGACRPRPVACPDVYDPVCGCDGVTYGNACEAAAAGASVAHRGPCVPSGCTTNADCPVGHYCAKAEGDCGGEGACRPRPEACLAIYDPVCGCDGVTYGNACEAAAAGASVAHRGECEPRFDCESDEECPRGSYCRKEPGDCEGRGTCTPRPEVCPAIYDPACGCDGVTYGNPCEAAAAGVSVLHRGPCIPSGNCDSNDDCGGGDYCRKAVGECGGLGVCSVRPVACPDVFDPVCGCDGVTYGNACEAAAAGVSVAYGGECGP